MNLGEELPSSSRSAAIRWLSNEYHEHNGSSYAVLQSPPTALEFSRLVHVSRPVLIKGYPLPALERWSDSYLIDAMDGKEFSVAVTPDGRADGITPGLDGKRYFVEPHVEKMAMPTFLSHLAQGSETSLDSGIRYLQSQNGNLYSSTEDDSEFDVLRKDVPRDVPWCTEALDRSPDAVNLWIGDSRSVTSIHSDPYENIYTVVRGAKHFTLLPPTEGWCLQERSYPHAQYTRDNPDSSLSLAPSPPSVPNVRWSSISNPHLPGNLPPEAHPIYITVNAGETLYLPKGWWHHVRQAPDITIAVNWWYDVESSGMDWVLLRFLRGPEEVAEWDAEEGSV
ncbi:hypothetical protein HGRIS_010034 [Hohenbuehelia grisea]|uniref:JmjC domain-containing protein n=1 Tax=Hohenbuehelia grisea TaxID=104357 RepID=A0ABR3J314_9AGAR